MEHEMGGVESSSSGFVAGFEEAETFRATFGFRQLIVRMIPLFVMLSLLLWILFTLLLGAVLGEAAWFVSPFVTAGAVYVLYTFKKRQFEENWPAATLELSPNGVVSADTHIRTELPWRSIQKIGHASLMGPLAGYSLLSKAVEVGAAASVRRQEDALIGVGSMRLLPGASSMVRKQVEQHERLVKRGEGGEPLRAIALAHFDRDWRNSRIGAWIRAYRPDLFTQQ